MSQEVNRVKRLQIGGAPFAPRIEVYCSSKKCPEFVDYMSDPLIET